MKAKILTEDSEVSELLRKTRQITVVGIKPETHYMQPAFYVPKYMQEMGYKIIPVPVYYPEVTEILGEKVYRHLSELPEHPDMVNVFRRAADIDKHIDEIIAAKPNSVWFQLGIVNDATAERFVAAGITVVQDRCLLVEHRALM